MLANIILLFLVFGAAKTRKKFNPYASAALLGVAKGVLYLMAGQGMVAAVIAALVFGTLAAGMIYFLARTEKQAAYASGEAYATPGAKKSAPFSWEYIPLAAIVLLLLFGDALAVMVRY